MNLRIPEFSDMDDDDDIDDDDDDKKMFAACTMPMASQRGAYNRDQLQATGTQESKLEEWWNSQVQANFARSSVSQGVQGGGNPQPSTSHVPVEDQMPEMGHKLPAAQGLEEMEIEDRDSDPSFEEGPRPTVSQ